MGLDLILAIIITLCIGLFLFMLGIYNDMPIVTIIGVIFFVIGLGCILVANKESNIDNAIIPEERIVTVTAEDGREIFYFIGNVKIISNNNRQLEFDGNGNNYIVNYGNDDTLIIVDVWLNGDE